MEEPLKAARAKKYKHVMVLGRMTLCEVIEPKPLKKNQIKALKGLGEPGHFRVNWRPNLSPVGYRDLKDRGLIQEAWTWASTTRPDVSITEAGVDALKATSSSAAKRSGSTP